MVTYKMYGSLAEADLISDDSSEAPFVCVGVDDFVSSDPDADDLVEVDDYRIVRADDGWWDVYYHSELVMDGIKAALAEMNHVAVSEIQIVQQIV